MDQAFIIRAGKLVTVSNRKTIHNGAMFIKNGKICCIGNWHDIQSQHPRLPVHDLSRFVVTPGLGDCHTHLMEFAPFSLFPVTHKTQFHAAHVLFLNALTSGITALGEQVCGHFKSPHPIDSFRHAAKDAPLDISFSADSVSIGFEELAHFTSITRDRSVSLERLKCEEIIAALAEQSDYPGENLFVNATPANFTADQVPNAGNILYTLDELKRFTEIFHKSGKKIGVHVAGTEAIDMCLEAGVDVLHHAHGMTESQMRTAQRQGTRMVATPLGGTHLEPNSPDHIAQMTETGLNVSIATDAYLPPHPNQYWLPFKRDELIGPDQFMRIAQPAMRKLAETGHEENDILALITANPAGIMNKENQFGRLDIGLDANFLAATGIPGLEIADAEEIKRVYYRGELVVER